MISITNLIKSTLLHYHRLLAALVGEEEEGDNNQYDKGSASQTCPLHQIVGCLSDKPANHFGQPYFVLVWSRIADLILFAFLAHRFDCIVALVLCVCLEAVLHLKL